MRSRLLFTVLVLAALVLAGCTGVPASSSPEVVQSVGAARPEGPQVASPAPGADERTIVIGFLAANAATDASHTSALAFLTPEAKNRWSDSTVTVIDTPQIPNPTAHHQITVSAHVIGTIDQSGVYTPKLQGDGTGVGEPAVQFAFGLRKVHGQWRIDQLQNGLIITNNQFQVYQQRAVYFYDLAEKHLVPDPRYTSLSDPGLLANWLITQMAKQPRPSLQGAVSTELPAQTNPKVTLGKNVKVVEVPGASRLDAATRNRLAGQIALTMNQVTPGAVFSITDGGNPVKIPAVGGTRFSATQFQPSTAATRSDPALYYIRNGAVLNSQGRPMPGPLGRADYLHSVALTKLAGTMYAAGTAGPSGHHRLLVGTQRRGLHKVGLTGELSRPAWAPGLDEVWVGDGSAIYRVSGSKKPAVVPATTTSGKLAGEVTALRFSPEGSRIAMVLTLPDRSAQVWVGTIVRTGAQVRIDGLAPISPAGVKIFDVAWYDQLKLFAVGQEIRNGTGGLYEVQCDGSVWTSRGLGGLPPVPDSITVTQGMPAAVSAGDTVWLQSAGTWVGIDNGATTSGTKPVYVQ